MARKKIIIEPIPFLIFLIIMTGLSSGLYFGVIIDYQSRKIQKGGDKFFMTLDNIIVEGNNESVSPEIIINIFSSIDREPGINGALSAYGYCNVLEDYIKRQAVTSDSLSELRSEIVQSIIKSDKYNVTGSYLTVDPLFDELKQAVEKRNYDKAMKYVAKIEQQEGDRLDKIEKLKRKNKWLFPIAISGTFFVFFFGLNQVVKIK